VQALGANIMLNVGDAAAGAALVDALVPRLADNGSLPGAATSITCSGGEGLNLGARWRPLRVDDTDAPCTQKRRRCLCSRRCG
jgi:hypothetical protein